MTRSVPRCVGFLNLAFLLALAPGPRLANAQPNTAPGGFVQSGMMNPRFVNPGTWAEVLTVTDNWLVLVNQQGQQFPVSRNAISLFVIRWPTTADRISANSLVEASGLDLSTNAVQTNHVDVYYGAAANLVSPGVTRVMGQNRTVTPFDIWNQTRYGFNYLWMMHPNERILPVRLHLVGPPVNTVPLQIGVGGNNFVTVVPSPSGLSVSQVTMGTFSVLRPGDIAYVANRQGQETPRSLNLSELVVYKQVPLDQFR